MTNGSFRQSGIDIAGTKGIKICIIAAVICSNTAALSPASLTGDNIEPKYTDMLAVQKDLSTLSTYCSLPVVRCTSED